MGIPTGLNLQIDRPNDLAILEPMKTPLLLVLLLGLGIGGCCVEAQEQSSTGNLLTNGAFESGLQGWKTGSANRMGSAKIDDVERFHGKPCLRIENTTEGETWLSQSIEVKPKTQYRLRGFIKTKNLTAPSGGTGASISLVHSSQRTEDLLKDTDWKAVSYVFNTGEKTKIEVGPRLGTYVKVKGTAWFAELSLECLTAEPVPAANVNHVAKPAPEVRAFVDNTGRVLRGQLMEVKDSEVTIKREPDGQVFVLKEESFCPADRAYFKEMAPSFVAPK